jgi:hypothetical protein
MPRSLPLSPCPATASLLLLLLLMLQGSGGLRLFLLLFLFFLFEFELSANLLHLVHLTLGGGFGSAPQRRLPRVCRILLVSTPRDSMGGRRCGGGFLFGRLLLLRGAFLRLFAQAAAPALTASILAIFATARPVIPVRVNVRVPVAVSAPAPGIPARPRRVRHRAPCLALGGRFPAGGVH